MYDTGCGIAEKDIGNLFSTFKSDEEDKPMGVTRGIGLGLSTTKLLAEAQGGSVEVESQLNQFTSIIFKIRIDEKTDILVNRKQTRTINPHLYVIQNSKTDDKDEDKSNKMKDMFGGAVKEQSELIPIEFDSALALKRMKSAH